MYTCIISEPCIIVSIKAVLKTIFIYINQFTYNNRLASFHTDTVPAQIIVIYIFFYVSVVFPSCDRMLFLCVCVQDHSPLICEKNTK